MIKEKEKWLVIIEQWGGYNHDPADLEDVPQVDLTLKEDGWIADGGSDGKDRREQCEGGHVALEVNPQIWQLCIEGG